MSHFGIIKHRKKKDEDLVTNIFSNVFQQTETILFRGTKVGSEDISDRKQRRWYNQHKLYQKKWLGYGLHEIGTMNTYMKHNGMGNIVSQYLNHDEIGEQIWN